MAFRRELPLVPTVERFVQLAGRADLRNLEASGELNLEDLLRSASATVYDKVKALGFQPEDIVNAEIYENAVAWQLLGVLAEAGYLGQEDAQAHFASSERFIHDVHPELAEGDEPRTTAEGIPAVQNATERPFRRTYGRDA